LSLGDPVAGWGSQGRSIEGSRRNLGQNRVCLVDIVGGGGGEQGGKGRAVATLVEAGSVSNDVHIVGVIGFRCVNISAAKIYSMSSQQT
jgi:hypothetical protein